MRLLTVPQPMASVLATPDLHGRPVVNRRAPASPNHYGHVVLVAGYLDRALLGNPRARSVLDDTGQDPEQLPDAGRAIAVAVLVESHQSAGACCAPWGNLSSAWWHLVLEDVRPISRPPLLPLRLGLSKLDRKEYAEVLTSL